MSQLVGRRPSKISSSTGKLRFLSMAARPYLLLRDEIVAISSGEKVVKLNLWDPCKQEMVKLPNQTLSKELSFSVKIGSSKGWVAMTNLDDLSLRLTNLYNPFASEKVVISLPPPVKICRGSLARVWNVSLSSSPDKEDCVVAAKLNAPFISLCRPGDSEWTHVETPPTFLTSEMMYSLRDRRFYLHSSRITGPNDLIRTSSDFPPVSPYQRFPFSDIPKSTEDLIESCVLRNQYLVQSPSGDSFIVFWCKGGLKKETIMSERRETKAFMVFRQDPEQGICSYTQDIGDLCIFLGKNEAFCVSASEYPGLNPNSVYFESHETGFGHYDLISNTVHDLTHLASSSFHLWLAPLH